MDFDNSRHIYVAICQKHAFRDLLYFTFIIIQIDIPEIARDFDASGTQTIAFLHTPDRSWFHVDNVLHQYSLSGPGDNIIVRHCLGGFT